jgi:Ca2+-binding EF-hand superfamily protein
MDDDNSRNIDQNEFMKAIHDYRIDVPESDLMFVFGAIDRSGDGRIDYEEFLRAVRGEMNPFRKTLVNRAFDRLDADKSGVIDITDVRRFYNAANHPEVQAGRKTEDQILNEFLETFETHHNINGVLDH